MVNYARWASRIQVCIGYKVYLRFLKDISLGFHDNNGNTYYGLSAHTLCKKYNKRMYPSQINKFVNGYQEIFTLQNLKRTFKEYQGLDENNETDKEWINGIDAYLKQICIGIKREISIGTIKRRKTKFARTPIQNKKEQTTLRLAEPQKINVKTEKNEIWKQNDEYLGLYQEVIPHSGMFHDKKVCSVKSRYKGKVSEKNNKLQAGNQIMIKKLQNIFENKNVSIGMLRDIGILQRINHQNIVKLYDVLPPTDPNTFASIAIIQEYAESNLKHILTTNQYFTRLHVQFMLYQILLAVKCVHSAGLIHTNLTPSNILMYADCSVKICDFDNSFNVNHTRLKPSNDAISNRLFLRLKSNPNLRSYYYAAPELLLLNTKHETLKAVDLWSVGAIFGELLQMIKENRQIPDKQDSENTFVGYFRNNRIYFVRSRAGPQRTPMFHGIVQHLTGPWTAYSSSSNSHWPDQLETIFNLIGYPDNTQIAKINDEEIREHLKHLRSNNSDNRNLLDIFPDHDMNAMDLMEQFLKYNANKRITADQALKHKYFEKVRGNFEEIGYKDNVNIFSVECDIDLSSDIFEKVMRGLILMEVMAYSEYQKDKMIKSDTMINIVNVCVSIANGYIRNEIEPLLSDNVVIPLCIIQMCCAYWCGQ